MLRKKYLFESKKRHYYSIPTKIFSFFIIFAIFAIWAITIYLPIYAGQQDEITDQSFFKKSPDVIMVFTGGAGRIEQALKMAQKYPSAKIFISGVYAKNSLKTLLEKQEKSISVEDFLEQESHHIELDYTARNTVENVIAAHYFLKKIINYKDVIIISSDYHLFRIAFIINKIITDPKYNFYYKSIDVDYKNFSNLKILFKETFKVFKAFVFLMFWD